MVSVGLVCSQSEIFMSSLWGVGFVCDIHEACDGFVDNIHEVNKNLGTFSQYKTPLLLKMHFNRTYMFRIYVKRHDCAYNDVYVMPAYITRSSVLNNIVFLKDSVE